MTTDELRNCRDAVPFQPFTIHMADGRTFRVQHRDFMLISPTGRTIIVYTSGDIHSVLDTMLMTELSVEAVPAASAIT